MNKNTHKQTHKVSRHSRVRGKVNGTAAVPRASVFKSNQHLIVQFIDDESRKTLLSASTVGSKSKGNKTELAASVGEMIGVKAKEKGIGTIVFDKGAAKYHGRVKALADGLRKSGLKF